MLGEKIGQTNGRLTGRRVLESEGGAPKVEVSFTEQGKLLGLDVQVVTTYSATMGPDGILHGQGQGVAMASNGEGATFVGSGVGTLKEGGGARFTGALYFQSASATLSRLNSITVVFEHEEDAEDNCHTTLTEWK